MGNAVGSTSEGSIVGVSVGVAEGKYVEGRCEGLREGRLEVGAFEGVLEGRFVGGFVGDLVGNLVGDTTASFDGIVTEAPEGCADAFAEIFEEGVFETILVGLLDGSFVGVFELDGGLAFKGLKVIF